MKAIVIGADGELEWQEVPDPQLRAGEVLLRSTATALNRADLFQRKGNYPVPDGESQILGLEVAGTVVAVAPDVTDVQVGDEGYALLGGGGYAELVILPAAMFMPKPRSLELTRAAGVPEVFLTAFSALFDDLRMQAGETLLLHAGASGVGTAAIQMAKRAGLTVIVTAGSERKLEACRELGADLAVNYREEDFAGKALEFTGGHGVDGVVDFVGEDYFDRNLHVLAYRGRMVVLSTLSGSKVELDLRLLMGKRIQLNGATLRARPLAEKVDLKERFLARFGDDLDAGRIGPVVDTVFPITRAQEAHEYMEQNRNIGKILLTFGEQP